MAGARAGVGDKKEELDVADAIKKYQLEDPISLECFADIGFENLMLVETCQHVMTQEAVEAALEKNSICACCASPIKAGEVKPLLESSHAWELMQFNTQLAKLVLVGQHKAKEQTEDLITKNRRLRDQLSEQNDKTKKLESHLQETQAANEKQTKKIADFEKERKQITAERHELIQQRDISKGIIEKAQNRIKILEAEKTAAEKIAADAKATIEKLESENKKLKALLQDVLKKASSSKQVDSAGAGAISTPSAGGLFSASGAESASVSSLQSDAKAEKDPWIAAIKNHDADKIKQLVKQHRPKSPFAPCSFHTGQSHPFVFAMKELANVFKANNAKAVYSLSAIVTRLATLPLIDWSTEIDSGLTAIEWLKTNKLPKGLVNLLEAITSGKRYELLDEAETPVSPSFPSRGVVADFSPASS